MSPREEFGLWLADSRRIAGLTQKDVAKRLGYSCAQHISNYERGLSVPSLSTAHRLMKMFGITVGQWMEAWRVMKAAEFEEQMQDVKKLLERKGA